MNDKVKTVVFTARVKEEDSNVAKEFINSYDKQHEGFSELLKIALSEKKTVEVVKEVIKEVPVEKNLEQVFDYSEYAAFLEPTDTHPVEAIKRGLEYANKAKETENTQETTTTVIPETTEQTGYNMQFPEQLDKKLNTLFRLLRSKGKIPQDSTPVQFMEKLCAKLLAREIDDKYEFLNKQ